MLAATTGLSSAGNAASASKKMTSLCGGVVLFGPSVNIIVVCSGRGETG